jgi:hypothetical protein
MAKKKKKAASQPISSSFDPARFREGEEASMADIPLATPTSVVDEQTKFQQMQAQETASEELTAAERAALLKKQREDEYFAAQNKAKGQKPEDPPADDQFTYQYVWRQDVGGPGGKWVLTKTPNAGPADWKFDSNGMLFYKGKAYTGNYQGIDYVNGKGPGYKENDGGGGTIYRTIGGILYANGSKYTGTYNGKKYVDGVEQADDGSGNKTTYTAPDGTIFTDLNAYNSYIAQTKAAGEKAARQSAYDLLFEQFNAYGLGGLVAPLKGLIESGINPAEFTIKLRETDAYKKRFAANQARIGKGLRALSEAEYIGLEDQYQDVMRRYGLPDTYYTRGEMGRQEGFEKFIGGDVSPVELEDRIQTAQRRVLNAAPQIKDALTQYYGNEISNGDILAYVLDPDKAIENIKRKVTAAEIGGAASIAGLGADRSRAEELQRFGVTGEQARDRYGVISEFLPQAKVLGELYAKQGLGAYTQETAEQELFGIPGSAEAGRKRRKLAELEQAQFSGSTGLTGGALGRERAGQF